MKFYKKELKDLLKAWFFISLAFAILFSGGINAFFNLNNFFIAFVISGLTVGIAFLFHELMHKAVAQKYGFQASFEASDKMLFLALIMSFFGFIIAAPGAVVIRAFNISKEKNGKISLAGPLTNIVFAFIFLILFLFVSVGDLGRMFFSFGFRINSLLAVFNLIPVMPFDGKKILDWNKIVYFLVVGFGLILFLISFF
jgi:Zn-dependent protease